MNEKGFATILGLCLLLAIALVVKGIQESEGNHAYETTDFQTELDLQNAAEVGIYKAVKMVRDNPNLLPVCKDVYAVNPRKSTQKKIITATEIPTLNDPKIIVDVWAERVIIKPYEVNYARKKNNKYIAYPFIDAENKNLGWKGYVFFSVAKPELKSSRTGGKLYRRAFAYVVESAIKETGGDVEENDLDIEDKKSLIHFMNEVRDDFYYEKINNPDRK